MPAKPRNTPTISRAELAFRDAFERLKFGKQKLLRKGTRVSQNNVAKEAGCDASALKKARFPDLVAEIQRWINEHAGSPAAASSRQNVLAQRNHNRDLRERIAAVESQRDKAMGLLAEADARILELTIENTRLQSHAQPATVTPMRLSS
ncbi:MAG TPA: hypothetical protein VIL60_01760 [Rhodanobacter sp.]